MAGVRSGRRPSGGLMLEESDKGRLVVSSAVDGSLANQGLKEGDEIVGATINFDQLSKDDVLKILKLMDDNGFDEKVQVLTKNNLCKSMATLDSIKAPEEMLKDSYNRLNAKIVHEKLMKEDSSGQPTASGERGSPNGQVKGKEPRPLWAKPNVRGTDSTVTLDAPGGELSLPNANMSTSDLSLAHLNGSLGADLDVNISDLPSVDLKGSKIDLELADSDIGISSGKIKTPSLGMADFAISGPRVRNPDLDLSAVEMCLSDVSLPDLSTPDIDIPSGKFKLKKPHAELKAPDYDVDAPSGKLKMPKFYVTGLKRTDLGIDDDVKTPKLILKAPKIKGGLDAPDLDLPKVDLKSPKLDVNTPDIDINAPSEKFKMPTFKMPISGLSGPKGPNVGIDRDLDGPDLSLLSSKLKRPDLDVGSPSGKLKIPSLKVTDFGFSGPDVQGPDLEVKTPDLDLSAPKFEGGISPPDLNLPDVDLKGPKLDLNAPDFDIDMPSGKVKVPTLNKPKVDLNAPDLDTDGPSGKLKMPKFNFFGTLPKGRGLDINAGVKSPKLKGGIDAPDMDLPDTDLKAPKLDVNTPDVDIDSPTGKFKLPKIKMPKFVMKRPDVDKDGDLEGPGLNLSAPKLDIEAPSMNLKGPKADLNIPNADFGSPSGNFKMPSFKMPDSGFSGPKVKVHDFEVKTPGLDLSAPKFKGVISPPDLNLTDLKGPKLDLNAPDVNFNVPSGKVNVPTLKKPKVDLNAPDLDINGPSGKLKMPKFGLSGKMPKSTKLNLKSPKIKGGLDSPDMHLSDADLKAPKLDGNPPDFDINAPSGKFKMPKFKIPKFRGLKGPDVDIDGDLEGPDIDINAPTANLKGPKTGLKMPDLKMPDFRLSGPNVDKPDYDLPDIDLSAPKLKGGISPPDLRL
ncbi:neuroblast differentiation-associated protein AHNAK-like [Oncorhynchus keta]|uniref:neuroblast differentiation-associated protein AHNAK-like n=1 Tax=Oncorhynchus keta TaxID=8018 RepID=UPI00227AE8D6|nr:neuroblast differentiation-associated protein AHNAK-like [Oncorhynchus keta]